MKKERGHFSIKLIVLILHYQRMLIISVFMSKTTEYKIIITTSIAAIWFQEIYRKI